MTPRHRDISGKDCVKILCNRFGFAIARRTGSHIILTKITENGKIGTVVPDHGELRRGTLKGILDLAKVPLEEFDRYL